MYDRIWRAQTRYTITFHLVKRLHARHHPTSEARINGQKVPARR